MLLLRSSPRSPTVQLLTGRLGRRSRTIMQAQAGSPPAPPKFLLLTYDYVPDILEKRAPHRAAHLAAAQRCVDDGTLLMAGAFTAAPMGAAFVFTPKATPALVEQFVQNDPYVAAKLVTKWRVAEWAVPVLSPAVTL